MRGTLRSETIGVTGEVSISITPRGAERKTMSRPSRRVSLSIGRARRVDALFVLPRGDQTPFEFGILTLAECHAIEKESTAGATGQKSTQRQPGSAKTRTRRGARMARVCRQAKGEKPEDVRPFREASEDLSSLAWARLLFWGELCCNIL